MFTFKKIWFHPRQVWTATTKYGVKEKEWKEQKGWKACRKVVRENPKKKCLVTLDFRS